MLERPEWWDWELDFGRGHLHKRMVDRSFNETDVRKMVDDAADYALSKTPGRYIIHSSLDSEDARIIVEPESATKLLVVVTVYFPG